MNKATFHGLTFSYTEKTIQVVDSATHEYCERYTNIVILESLNPRFLPGDTMDQLTVSVKIDR